MLTVEELMSAMMDATGQSFDEYRNPDDEAGFLSQAELMKKLNVGERKLRAMLSVIQSQGRLETRRVKRERLDGLKKTITVFRVLPEKPKKRKLK